MLKVTTGKGKTVEVETVEEAMLYVGGYNLGASAYYKKDIGRVLNENGEEVANISYNGRVWEGKRQ